MEHRDGFPVHRDLGNWLYLDLQLNQSIQVMHLEAHQQRMQSQLTWLVFGFVKDLGLLCVLISIPLYVSISPGTDSAIAYPTRLP